MGRKLKLPCWVLATEYTTQQEHRHWKIWLFLMPARQLWQSLHKEANSRTSLWNTVPDKYSEQVFLRPSIRYLFAAFNKSQLMFFLSTISLYMKDKRFSMTSAVKSVMWTSPEVPSIIGLSFNITKIRKMAINCLIIQSYLPMSIIWICTQYECEKYIY